MSSYYTKSSWNSGSTITSSKMNNMENGIYNIYNATSAIINANSYGTNSVAIGNASTLANYAGAIAIGVNASSYTYHGIAIGIGANVSSNYGTVLGGMADVSGYCGTALGYGANVYGNYSVAICYKANANGACTLSFGYNSSAEENYSIAIGASSHSTNTYAISCGYNANSSGNVSIAFGPQSISNSYYSSTFGAFTRGYANYCTAVGYYAYCANANSIQLGNASYLSTLTCKVSLTTTSDERDKTDITEIDDGAVDFLNSIKAIRYVFNGRELYIDEDNLSEEDQEKRAKYGLCAYDTEAHDAGTKKGSRIRVGVSAQEVQAALETIYGDSSYANLVNDNLYDFDDVPDDVESQLAVNYDGFIPFLIKAIQELSDRILILESEVAAIE